ncbi:MAG: DUF177 domain-containing protein [Bacteroidales bacterium]|nr:DUF177 domain-containing protein [Bacteroidales bacterium]
MSRKSDTTIQFSGLKPGKYTYEYALNKLFFDKFENDEIEDVNVEIVVEMERMERMLMFDFKLEGELTTFCDRCLGKMTIPISGEEHLTVRFSDTEVCEDEDVVVLPESAFEIDLAQWLYEFVAVRIPMQHSHPEGECDPETVKFISSDEELQKSDDEVDPRWEVLRNLK